MMMKRVDIARLHFGIIYQITDCHQLRNFCSQITLRFTQKLTALGSLVLRAHGAGRAGTATETKILQRKEGDGHAARTLGRIRKKSGLIQISSFNILKCPALFPPIFIIL